LSTNTIGEKLNKCAFKGFVIANLTIYQMNDISRFPVALACFNVESQGTE